MACPFCGGADIRQGEDDFGWYQVYCGDCGSCMEDSLPHKAIEAWNRRTPARELDAEKGGEDEFVVLCHDGQPCKKLYGPTEYPTPKAATPPPNWCRTCGKHWSDPVAVFCSDGIHNPNKATPPAQAAESVQVASNSAPTLSNEPADTIHSCSPYCDLPACVKEQRDHMRDATAGEGAVRVTKQMCYRAIDAYTEAVGEGWQQPCVQGMYAALDAAIAAMQAGEGK